jgi:hypothetical protein
MPQPVMLDATEFVPQLGGELGRSFRVNTAQRVIHFLRKQAGHYLCDDCIVRELRLSKSVTGVTDVIGKGSNLQGLRNRRELAICSQCGEYKLSTMTWPENSQSRSSKISN